MKKRKTLTILLIIMLLTAVMVPTLALADDFTGQITISSNNTPTIDTFTVDCGSAMSPTSIYNVSLTVTDLDGISNLNDIMLVFWYETASGDPVDLPAFTQGDNDSKVLNWVEVWDGTTFAADTTNTTWAATTPLDMVVDGPNSHTFDFTVTVGKEAQEAAPATDTDKWQIAVKLTDDNANTAFQLVAAATPITNDWYGEMTASVGAGPFWNNGAAGMAYADEPSQVFDATYTLSIISNGDFSLRTYAATTWNNGSNDILYDIAVDAAEEFSIAVDTDATYNVGTAQELPNDPGATGSTDPLTITTPVGWGTGTDYSGVSISNVYMFLQTNASMTTGAPYTGNVTFTVVNN